MDYNQLLSMMRGTAPRNVDLMERFIRYQAGHFEESWQELLEKFYEDKGRIKAVPQVYQFETDLSAFAQSSSYEGVRDIVGYTVAFGQAGLKKLPQLTADEKQLVLQVALYNLATRFQLLNQEGSYQDISLQALLTQLDRANLVNVFRVANNLADRISRDVEVFLLDYEPPSLEEENKVPEIQFREDETSVSAYLGDQLLTQMDRKNRLVSREAAYQDLSLSQKVQIIDYFDQLKPHLRVGEFDTEVEAISVSRGSEVVAYLESDGTVQERLVELTQAEETELTTLGRSILEENLAKLSNLGYKKGTVGESKERLFLDAVGRFQLEDEKLSFLLEHRETPELNLAMAIELLGIGVDTRQALFFLESSLSLEDLRFVGFQVLHHQLTYEDAKAFEELKMAQPTTSNRDLMQELQVKKETPKEEVSEVEELVIRLREQFPIGTKVNYKGQEFDIQSIENAQLNNLVRIELKNDYSWIVEENPVLYLNSFQEVERLLKKIAPVKADTEEITLFSFEEEEEKLPDIETIQEEPHESISDFVFPEDMTDFYPKTNRDKVASNIAAIRLVKELEATGKQANHDQQLVLARYVGWGGLANEFFDESNTRFEKEREELKQLVTEKEYSDMKQSSLTAYYTDPMIIRKMWQKLLDDGFTGGRILDPSMGTGNFFASMPASIREHSELYGVELDGVTGAIAKQLHPNVKIWNKGFEEIPFQEGSFDLVMTNVPFGNIRIADTNYDRPYLIHDYFVKRALDLTVNGGQVALLSSIGTMDKRTDNVLQDIKDIADFLGGVRLPDTTFKEIAGTRVTTDILFFQKNQGKVVSPDELAFSGSVRYEKDQRIWLNPYFEGEFNSQVLGNYEVRNFNGGTLAVKGTSEPLELQLADALKQVKAPQAFLNPVEKVDVLHEEKQNLTVPAAIRENLALYSYGYEGNTIYYRDRQGIRIGSKVDEVSYYVNDEGKFQAWESGLSQNKIDHFLSLHLTDEEALDVYRTEEPSKRGQFKGLYKKTVFYESPLSEKDSARIKGMVAIRDTYQTLIDLQRKPDYNREIFQQFLEKLNQDYDRFVKAHGFLNASVNRNLFDSDDKYSLLASLEDEYIDERDQKVKYKKSLAFEKALVRPEKEVREVSSALDALNSSLADGRGVDISYMLSIYPNHGQEELIAELGDQILVDPESYRQGEIHYISKPQFLSGDILSKIEVVELLLEDGNQDHDWAHALALLEEVRPPRIPLADIDFRIGSRWIPQSIYGKFAFETFADRLFGLDAEEVEQVIETNPLDGRFDLTRQFAYRYHTAKDRILGVPGSHYDEGRKIFENLLNSNQPTITMTVEEGGKKKTITDLERTSVLRAKEQEIQSLFQDFVSRYPEIASLIEDSYNRLYNRTVSRNYDGSHLTIDGLAQHITLRPHQKNAIQRIVEEKRALLAHEVGSGKTLTMLGAGFKLKELGMIHKPLYVVPSSLTAQFGQEIMKFFPTKKVFVTTKKDFVKARRKQFVSRIITGDYDAIVIGDSQFEKIPMSKERQVAYIQDKLEELRDIKAASDNKMTVKEAEKSILAFVKQLTSLQKLNRDTFIEFENLGIDFLFVDEAHHFKNIRPVTGLGNVAGITNTTSKKNVDMEMKVRQIQEEHGNRNVVFATGTPVSNSISELYTMMNYLQPDVLARYQVQHFDSWVGAFGEIQNSMELAPTGDKYQPKKRFKKFVNLPELMKFTRKRQIFKPRICWTCLFQKLTLSL